MGTVHRAAPTIGAVRIVLQRVMRASVTVDGAVVGAIGPGVLLLVGVGDGDDPATAQAMAGKVARLRIFPNGEKGFDRSLTDVGGEALVVSQFSKPVLKMQREYLG